MFHLYQRSVALSALILMFSVPAFTEEKAEPSTSNQTPAKVNSLDYGITLGKDSYLSNSLSAALAASEEVTVDLRGEGSRLNATDTYHQWGGGVTIQVSAPTRLGFKLAVTDSTGQPSTRRFGANVSTKFGEDAETRGGLTLERITFLTSDQLREDLIQNAFGFSLDQELNDAFAVGFSATIYTPPQLSGRGTISLRRNEAQRPSAQNTADSPQDYGWTVYGDWTASASDSLKVSVYSSKYNDDRVISVSPSLSYTRKLTPVWTLSGNVSATLKEGSAASPYLGAEATYSF